MMPEEELQKIEDEVATQLNAMGDTSYNAAGASMVKAEYKAMDMDIDGMQSNYILYASGKMLLVALCLSLIHIYTKKL